MGDSNAVHGGTVVEDAGIEYGLDDAEPCQQHRHADDIEQKVLSAPEVGNDCSFHFEPQLIQAQMIFVEQLMFKWIVCFRTWTLRGGCFLSQAFKITSSN